MTEIGFVPTTFVFSYWCHLGNPREVVKPCLEGLRANWALGKNVEGGAEMVVDWWFLVEGFPHGYILTNIQQGALSTVGRPASTL